MHSLRIGYKKKDKKPKNHNQRCFLFSFTFRSSAVLVDYACFDDVIALCTFGHT